MKKLMVLIFVCALFVFVFVFLIGFFKKKDQEFFFSNQNNKRSKLMKLCGLPLDYDETSHCFADGTHQTCCMLGPEARKYADESGNPIGEASEKANKYLFLSDNNRNKNENKNKRVLKPWCTCFGSKVCSYYSKKFNDGTHIKFVNNPNSTNEIREKISPDCEGYFRNKFSIVSHRTPGINLSDNQNHNQKTSCEQSGRYSEI